MGTPSEPATIDEGLLSSILSSFGDRLYLVDPDAPARPDDTSGGWPPVVAPADLVVAEDRPIVASALRVAALDGQAAATARLKDDPASVRDLRIRRLDDDARPAPRYLVLARDGTSHRAHRRDLDTSGRLHKALVEAISEMIWHLDVRTDAVQRWGWEAFTGERLPAGDSHAWERHVHECDRAAAVSEIAAAVARKAPFTVRYRLRHAGGGWRWVKDHAVPILDPDGAVTDWVGVVSDRQEAHAAAEALRASEQTLRAALEASGLGTWAIDLETGECRVSPELRALLGLAPDGPVTVADLDALLGILDQAPLETGVPPARDDSAPGRADGVLRIVRPDDGRVRWIRSLGRTMRDGAGRPQHRIGTVEDITESVETRLALRSALIRSEALIAATSVIVWRYDPATGTGSSQGWEDYTGLSRGNGGDSDWLIAIHPDDVARVALASREGVERREPYTIEYRLHHNSGDHRWVVDRVIPMMDDTGEITEWIGIISDEHARKTADDEIRRAAHTDDLTGLPNRRLFRQRLEAAVSAADGTGRPLGLVLIDLDHLKVINDGLGHDAGDLLIKSTAERLLRLQPPQTTVARLGGDEFGLLVPDMEPTALETLVRGVMEELSRPVRFGAREMHCTTTAGYAVYPLHDPDPAALLKNADMALYAAKSAGRGGLAPFVPELRADLDRRIGVLRSAREALLRDAVEPFYQPKISLRTGLVTGFEALLRWNDGHGLKPPGAILEAFEDHDLAGRLGGTMLRKVCADMAGWRAGGIGFGHVALNLAGPELLQPGVADRILRQLEMNGLPAGCLEAEVTERVLMETGNETISRELLALREGGIAIALDDFGTGYASLTHLKRHPVSFIKIDRSFVSNLETERDSAAIVQALLGMAANLEIGVVAEGVETDWQLGFLQRHGCDLAQGYLIAKPMPASRVPHFLRTWTMPLAGDVPSHPRLRAGA